MSLLSCTVVMQQCKA